MVDLHNIEDEINRIENSNATCFKKIKERRNVWNIRQKGEIWQYEYRKSGKSGLKISAISLGLWHNLATK